MNKSSLRVLVTGGAGFIGSNLMDHLLQEGYQVTAYDNLSRKGPEKNAAWLKEKYGQKFRLITEDIRNYPVLLKAVDNQDLVYHLAAQVAVTTSIKDPREDFEINALGTLNVLEAARETDGDPIVLYSSTNKVYGEMADLRITEDPTRCQYADMINGIPESRLLDFYSPYGCSKGIGDQYFIDYARIYGLKTVVFRQSCIYGIRQFGDEDQGWVAHFLISAALGKPITIYGDGKQLRDVLYMGDLIKAFEMAVDHITSTSGQAYNIGGGPENTISLLELISYLESKTKRQIKYSFHNRRPGDQIVYVSNIGKAKKDFGWSPTIPVKDGIDRLFDWVTQNRHLFE